MIKKAIIPVAGKGTRMAPITDIIAKEMLPIGTIPTLQYIVMEAVASGIEQILFVINHEKGMVAKYFAGTETPVTYEKGGMYEYNCLGKQIGVCFSYQGRNKGSGAAVLCGKDFAAGQAVAVLFGDDIIVGDVPATKQLMDVSSRFGYSSVLGVQHQPEHIVRTCAMVEGIAADETCGKVVAVQEKPDGELRSDLTSLGRFVINKGCFDLLETTAPHAGEIWLTDAINHQTATGDVAYCVFSGERYDVGNKYGYIRAFTDLAVANNEIESYQNYVSTLTRR